MAIVFRFFLFALSFAVNLAFADGDESANIQKLLHSKFPQLEIETVTKSPYFGLYEIVAGDQTLYTDPQAKYLIVGNILDLDSKINLSEQKLQKMHAINWSSLPLDLAIKTVKGNGSRRMAVFADADCPYCRRLESELKSVDNLTIYTFLYPIDQLHPDSNHKSKMIWCAPDREKAWKNWIIDGQLPNNDAKCDTPLSKIAALGGKFHIVATPTLVFADGHTVPGALPIAQLEKELQSADAGVGKP